MAGGGDVETVELELVAPVTVTAKALTDPGRSLAMVVDKPPRLGGTDRGAMPSEYFLAALASCNMMTARRIAEKRSVPWKRLRCTAEAHFAGGDISKCVLRYQVTSTADAAAWETVLRLAAKTCTISKVTACPIEHTVEISTAA